MGENGIIGQHGQKTGKHSAGTAEEETVNHAGIGAQLPDAQKEQQQKETHAKDPVVVYLMLPDIQLLGGKDVFGAVIFHGKAPSIID